MRKILTAILILALIAVIIAGCSADSTPETTGEVVGEVPNFPDDETYTLDTEQSTLTYEAYRLTGNGHVGTVDITEGRLVREDGTFTEGSFTIDMTTITEDKNNERFLGHVRNEDFFNVEMYPTSTFTMTSIAHEEGNRYMVTGDLTILDQTHEISFPATVRQEGDAITVDANFEIDRTRWGIVYDSGSFFQELGERAIKDEVEYTLDLTFTS